MPYSRYDPEDIDRQAPELNLEDEDWAGVGSDEDDEEELAEGQEEESPSFLKSLFSRFFKGKDEAPDSEEP